MANHPILGIRLENQASSPTSLHISERRTENFTLAAEVQQEISKQGSRLICFACFVIVFTACGLPFVYGLYQALYEEMSNQPNNPFTGASPALIDLIGTLAIALMTAGAPLAVAWAKYFSPRKVCMLGGIIFGLSGVLASYGTNLWHFMLTQGILSGVGSCMSYMVACTVAPSWYTTHRGLAMGIITSGTGVGGVVWAQVVKAGFDHLGFRTTLRLVGIVSAVLLVSSGAVLRWEPSTLAAMGPPHDLRNNNDYDHREGRSTSRRQPARLQQQLRAFLTIPLLNWRIAKTQLFVAQALASILQSAAYYTPVFFYASYARSLGHSDQAGANFTAISHACNALGKIAIGYCADRFGRINTLFVTTLISAVATYVFWLPSTLGGPTASSSSLYLVFIIFYGIFSSAFVAIFPTSLIELFGIQNFASVNGVLYMVRGFSTLVGTPVGGALIRSGKTGPVGFMGMAIFVGALLFGATAAVGWVQIEGRSQPNRIGSRGWKF